MRTLLIADADRMTRAGLRAALREAGRCVCVADAAAALAAAADDDPDVALVAADLPDGGLAAVRRLAIAAPRMAIVVLSTRPTEDELLAAVLAGAAGYVGKDVSAARLPPLVEGVLAGEAALPRRLTPRILAELRGVDHRRAQVSTRAGATLSAREWQVLELLADEATTGHMANTLGISEVTVRRHVSSLVSKLGVADRAAAGRLLRSAN